MFRTFTFGITVVGLAGFAALPHLLTLANALVAVLNLPR